MLVKTALSAVMLNRYPYNNGHVMIVPIQHVSSLLSLDQPTLLELVLWTQISESILGKTYRPQGFNVGINIGAAAGAGLESHLHIHVLPRWSGDTNFMTTVADTRVIPETHESTWHRLGSVPGRRRTGFLMPRYKILMMIALATAGAAFLIGLTYIIPMFLLRSAENKTITTDSDIVSTPIIPDRTNSPEDEAGPMIVIQPFQRTVTSEGKRELELKPLERLLIRKGVFSTWKKSMRLCFGE